MKTVSVEIDENLAKGVLSGLEKRQQELQVEIESIQSQIEKICFAFELNGHISPKPRQRQDKLDQTTPSGRRVKGGAEVAILSYLTELNGAAVSLKDILEGLKLPYSTGFKNLIRLRNEGKIVQTANGWKI